MRYRAGGKRLTNKRLNAIDAFYAAASPKGAIPTPRRTRAANKQRDPNAPSEHKEQVAVIQWWDLVCKQYGLPYFALFAIPNGGARNVITGSRLKAEGVRRGSPDLMLAAPRDASHGLFIEMKVGDNKPTEEQAKFIEHLNSQRYETGVCYSAVEAIRRIETYFEDIPF